MTIRHPRVPRRRTLRLIAALATVGLVTVGCSQWGESPAAPAPTSSSRSSDSATTVAATTSSAGCATEPATEELARGAQVDRGVESSAVDRTYKLYLPTGYKGTPTPLVVDLHGYLSGAAGQLAMSDLATDAESTGFVVATPQGNGPMPYWNAVPQPELPDDVQFIADVIDDAGNELCIDTTRVYVQGFSNGAFLASLIACELSDKVAAVAAVAGLQVPRDCAPSRPVPILGIHGTEDRFVSFEGSPNDGLAQLTWDEDSTRAFEDLPFAPVEDAVAAWARLDDCAEPPTEQVVSTSVARLRYDDCRDGATVELISIEGAGHTWPASTFAEASESLLGPATAEIDANQVIWTFFKEHRLPG